MKVKLCTKCKKEISVCNFRKRNYKQKHLLHSWCKFCEAAYTRQYCKNTKHASRKRWAKEHREYLNEYRRRKYKENPLQSKNWELKTKYGITLKEWKEMFEKQGKACAICGVPVPNTKNVWHTDHDHKTEKVRGILCGKCNAIIGFSGESISTLQATINYLILHKESINGPER